MVLKTKGKKTEIEFGLNAKNTNGFKYKQMMKEKVNEVTYKNDCKK